MQDLNGLTPGEKELEAAWGNLKLTAPSLSRDHVMFQAGRASNRQQQRLWQGISSALTVLLVMSIVQRPASVQREGIPDTLAQDLPRVGISDESQSAHQQLQPVREYLHTRGKLLEYGLDSLPAARPAQLESSEPPLTRAHLDDMFSSS